MSGDKPKLLFQAKTNRRPYFRRFMWMLLGTVTLFSGYLAFEIARGRDESVPQLLAIASVLMLLIGGSFFIRMVVYLYRFFVTPTETVRVFVSGFTWERGDDRHKYSFMQVRSFREGARPIKLFGRRIATRGAHELTMRDGRTFKFSARHGDTDRFAKSMRKQIGEVTGTAMSRSLRNKKSVKIHPKLVVAGGGLMAGKEKISWTKVDIKRKGNTLQILKLAGNGKFKQVRKYPVHQIDNLPGFLDLADSLVRNAQPRRFNIRVKGV